MMPVRLPPRAVLLDFDFTLGDSSGAILECVGHALTHLGLTVPPSACIHKTVGLPLDVAFRALAGSQDEITARQFVRLYHQHAEQVMESSTVIYDDAHTELRELHGAGVSTGIVSTKRQRTLRGILRRNRLEAWS
jgi:phosphoglycolate phosphatase